MSDTCINKEFNIKYANAKKMMIPKELGRYTLQKLIMQSPKCVVVSSIFPGTTEKVAIKCIPIEIFKKIAKEDDIMKQINHPNIIKYYDSFMYPNQNPRFFAIVMARGVDDLYNYVERNGPLPEEIVCQIMRQALNAVSYLHSNQIWHRDLKLDNILLMEEARNGFKIAITDFGLSDNFNCDEYTGKCCGTLEYAAPELVQNLYGGLCFKLSAVCLYDFNFNSYLFIYLHSKSLILNVPISFLFCESPEFKLIRFNSLLKLNIIEWMNENAHK